MGVKRYIKNLLRYIKTGGEWQGPPIVKVSVSFTQPNHRFEGKKVLVTGGSSGIGKEIAKEFLSEGAEVVITGRRKELLELACCDLKSSKLHPIVWDVSDVKEMHSNFEQAIKIIGGCDIVVNNAGVCVIDKIDENAYDRQCDVNTKGLYFLCREVGQYMITNKIRGHIINITSIAGIKSAADPYSISKWGANCLTKGFAKDLIANGIVVNAVAPGNVITNIHSGYKGLNIEDNAYCVVHPSKRYTLVEEVASLVLFLASESANNIVGQVIAVDGGRTIL